MDNRNRCWCDWPDPADPDETHDDHIRANDYPDHEVSPEWNLPESLAGE